MILQARRGILRRGCRVSVPPHSAPLPVGVAVWTRVPPPPLLARTGLSPALNGRIVSREVGRIPGGGWPCLPAGLRGGRPTTRRPSPFPKLRLGVLVHHDFGRRRVRAGIHLTDNPISPVHSDDLGGVAPHLKLYAEVVVARHRVALDPAIGVLPDEDHPHVDQSLGAAEPALGTRGRT